MKVAEDHGKQKAAFYAGFSVGQQEVILMVLMLPGGGVNKITTTLWHGEKFVV